MPAELRPYRAEDFETLYKIDQACYPRGIAYSRQTLREFLDQKGADCWVAEAAGKIAGFIIAESNATQAHIITIDVLAPHRRRGLGTELLRVAEARLAAGGVERVELETATDNEAAVAFWKKHGYRTHAIVKNYYPGRIDAYAMNKMIRPATEFS